jgi:hypothetical protein
MKQEASNSGVCTQGSIPWSPNDPYAQVLGQERPGRVRGVGLGPTPGRVRYNSFGASTSANQPGYASRLTNDYD